MRHTTKWPGISTEGVASLGKSGATRDLVLAYFD